jgi:hypothetical protein
MNARKRLITDGQLIEEMKRAIWRDDARHAGVAEPDIERTVFFRWRIARAGGPQVAVYGLGRIRAASEEA